MKETKCAEQLLKLYQFFQSMPTQIIETLYFWVVRSGFLLIKVETEVDDQVVLKSHCDFIVKILKIILQPCMKHVEQDFTIDLRNFKNFTINENEAVTEETLDQFGLMVGK